MKILFLNKIIRAFHTSILCAVLLLILLDVPALGAHQGVDAKSGPKLPLLKVKENSVSFTDTDGNNRLDAGELATVEFVLMNKGNGVAKGLKVISQLRGITQDITIAIPAIPTIGLGKEQTITTILKAGVNVQSGKAMLKLIVTEPNGLDSSPVEVEFNILAFQPPNVVAADGIFTSESGGTLKINYPVNLEVLVQNTGTGNAENITTDVRLPEHVLNLEPPHLPIARLKPGESVRLNTAFIVTARYPLQEVPIKIILKEKHGMYGSMRTLTARIDQPLATAHVFVKGDELNYAPVIPASLHSDVDKDIPINLYQNTNRFALVIGNEDYKRFQTGLQSDQNVAFARNDASVFREYLRKTFGFPEKQVFILTDATRGQMSRELERVVELVKLNPGAELVFYYAGHGLPDFETRQGYLIPVDVTASDLKDGISLQDLYIKLASSKASKILVFLDACFSGGGRGENGLLASRTVKIKPKGDIVEGNIVAFTAASGEEASLALDKESHGLFTYFLLKKMKASRGDFSLQELKSYLESEVSNTSLIENGSKQSPQVLTAPDLENQWQTWKIKEMR